MKTGLDKIMEKPIKRGFTFIICIGAYDKFGIEIMKDPNIISISLGWIAIRIMSIDLEVTSNNIIMLQDETIKIHETNIKMLKTIVNHYKEKHGEDE